MKALSAVHWLCSPAHSPRVTFGTFQESRSFAKSSFSMAVWPARPCVQLPLKGQRCSGVSLVLRSKSSAEGVPYCDLRSVKRPAQLCCPENKETAGKFSTEDAATSQVARFGEYAPNSSPKGCFPDHLLTLSAELLKHTMRHRVLPNSHQISDSRSVVSSE